MCSLSDREMVIDFQFRGNSKLFSVGVIYTFL